MSDIKGRYKQIIEDLENNIQNPEELNFVKDKFSELSMVFIDMLDRITRLTDNKIQEIEQKQQEILNKINSVQSVVDEIEGDIYEDDENYEFEIVCPYCNYEFIAGVEDECKAEIQCPECHNSIELDWNTEEEASCTGSCMNCISHCIAEETEEYNIDENKDDKEDM